jgi:hypothetical protein
MAWRNYNSSGTKYHNNRVTVDGMTFDSHKELSRYRELTIMQKAGMIRGLERQKKFLLIPSQREPDQIGKKGGKKKGAVIEREVAYYADFFYYDHEGREVVEDVKSPITRTKDYIIKRKLLLYKYGIRIREI